MLMASSSMSSGGWFGDVEPSASAIATMLRREEVDMDLDTGLVDFCAALDEELEKERKCCKGKCGDGWFC